MTKSPDAVEGQSRTGTGLRLFMWLSLGCLAVALCCMRASRIDMDDDNLFLAYAAQSQVDKAKPIEQSLIDRAAATPGCEESAYRLALRKRYSTNYWGYAVVQGVVQDVATHFVASGPKSIILATLAAKALFLMLLLAALAVAAHAGASREIAGASICAFVLLVALDFGPGLVRAPSLVAIKELTRTIGQQLSSVFVVHKSHSYFEVTPRNGALLLFVTSLLLKWQGHLTAAVLAILMIALIHQTYGGLGFVLFVATAAVSRPEIFVNPLRRAVLIGAGLLYVVRENFLARFDLWVQVACDAGLVLAGLVFFHIVCSARYSALRQRCLGRWANAEVGLDAVLLSSLVALITLVSWVGDQVTQDPITRHYVWANFPIRTLSFVRFPVFIALLWLILVRTRWLSRPRGRSWVAAACAAGALLLGLACATQIDGLAWQRLQGQMANNLRPARHRGRFDPYAEENRIYAHLTMIAAGKIEPADADERIVARRAVTCRAKR